jgi:hypothetical protein
MLGRRSGMARRQMQPRAQKSRTSFPNVGRHAASYTHHTATCSSVYAAFIEGFVDVGMIRGLRSETDGVGALWMRRCGHRSFVSCGLFSLASCASSFFRVVISLLHYSFSALRDGQEGGFRGVECRWCAFAAFYHGLGNCTVDQK